MSEESAVQYRKIAIGLVRRLYENQIHGEDARTVLRSALSLLDIVDSWGTDCPILTDESVDAMWAGILAKDHLAEWEREMFPPTAPNLLYPNANLDMLNNCVSKVSLLEKFCTDAIQRVTNLEQRVESLENSHTGSNPVFTTQAPATVPMLDYTKRVVS